LSRNRRDDRRQHGLLKSLDALLGHETNGGDREAHAPRVILAGSGREPVVQPLVGFVLARLGIDAELALLDDLVVTYTFQLGPADA